MNKRSRCGSSARISPTRTAGAPLRKKPLAQALALVLFASGAGMHSAPAMAEYGSIHNEQRPGPDATFGGFEFGNSVAVDGDWLVVGAGGGESVYVFARQPDGSWNSVTILQASDGVEGDLFGSAVAIKGNRILVGAPDGNEGAGAAYLFTLDESLGWQQTGGAIMSTAPVAGAKFGNAVALTANLLVVGAYKDTAAAMVEAGAVYVFDGASATKLSGAAAYDWFGYSVAVIDSPINLIAVGAVHADANGAVYSFRPNPAPPAGSGPELAVAAYGWYEFDKTLASDGLDSDFFGSSIAIDTVNRRMLVGASRDDSAAGVDTGSAYLFDWTASGWVEATKLTAETPAAGDQFGDSVAIGDELITIGAFGDSVNGADSGAVHVFSQTEAGADFVATERVEGSLAGDNFGNAVAMSGNVIAVAAQFDDDAGPQSGSVHTYEHAVDLAVTISDDTGDGYAAPGDSVIYTVVATNNDAEVTATSVELVYTLPAGTSFVSAALDGVEDSLDCSDVENTVTCTVESLAPGESATLVVTASVDGYALPEGPALVTSPGDQLDGSASVTAAELELNDTDNSASNSIEVNIRPVVDALAIDTVDNDLVEGRVTGRDGDGDELTFTLKTQPSHGSVTFNPSGTFGYQPNPQYTGPDSFTFYATDGKQESADGTVSFTVRLDPRPPVAVDASAETGEDTPISVQLVASDPNLDELSFDVTTQPQHGSASVDPITGLWTYTPANRSANYPDTFVVTVTANGDTAAATITVNVTADDDAPVFDAVTPGTANEQSGGTGSVSATDPDTDQNAFAFTVIGQSTIGSATFANPGVGTWSYTAQNRAANYTTSFTVQVDSNGLTDTAVVPVTVTASNEAPTATEANIITNEDETGATAPNVTDGDVGDTHTFQIDSQPGAFQQKIALQTVTGTASVSADGSQLIFTPDANSFGTTSFTYRAIDAAGSAVLGTAQVTVNAVNDAPTSVSASIITDEDTESAATDVAVVDVDDASGHTIAIVTQPANGSAIVLNNQLIYTPNADFEGSDSFTVSATDDENGQLQGTVTVTVNPINDPPSATSAFISTAEDTPSTPVSPDVVDVDLVDEYTVSLSPPQVLTSVSRGVNLAADVQAQNGVASVVNNQLVYTPNANYVGNDSFTYYVTDSGGYVVMGLASVTVGAENDAPSETTLSIVTDEDTPSAPTAPSVTDVDDDTHTFNLVGQPAHGTVELADGMFVYTPDADYSGSDSFQYRAVDSANASVVGTASVTVNPINDAPSSASASISAVEDQDAALVTPTVVDADSGDSHIFAIVSEPSHGSAAVTAGNQLLYTPDTDYFGDDSFTFSAKDGSGEQVIGTASVTVSSVNDVPSVANATISTDEDTPSTPVAPVVTDVDDESHTIAIVSQPSNGTASVVDGALVYTPNANFTGGDSFVFSAQDAAGATVNGTASVTVNAVNDAPTLLHGFTNGLIVAVGGSASVSFAATDVDGDTLSYSVSGPADPIGTASMSGSTLSFAATTAGTGELTVTVSDGNGGSDSYTFPLTVRAAPVDDSNSDGISDIDAAALGLDPAALGGDSDGDGTPDSVELGSLDKPVDSDGDGIIDALEVGDAANDASKLSFRVAENTADSLGLTLGDGPVTLQAGAGQSLSVTDGMGHVALVSGDASLPGDSSFTYPLGVYGFSVTTGGAATATVTITFPSGTVIPAGAVVRKVDINDNWQNFAAGTVDTDARTLTLTLVDNDTFDHNSTVGVIEDPVGLGSAKASSDDDGGTGSGSPWALLGLALTGLWTRLRRRG